MAIVISGVNNNDKITATDGLIDLLSTVSFASTVTAPAFTASGNITAASINVGNNIQLGNAGVVTATTFVGNLTGNVNNTGNLLLQIGGSEKFRIGGSGQLGIGGANYGTSGQVLTSGGSGSAATWSTVSGTTINSNTNNYLITGTGTANTLQGESNLTWDGNSLGLTAGTGNQFPIQIRNDFTPNSQRADYASLLNATSNNTLRLGSINSNGGATIQVTRGNDSSIKHDLLLQPDGGNVGVNYTSTQNWGAKFRVGGLLLSDQGAGSPYVFGKLSSAQDFVIGRTDVSGTLTENFRIQAGGKISTGGITNPVGAFCIDTGTGTDNVNTLEIRRDGTSDYSAVMFTTGTTVDWSIGHNSAGHFEIFEDGADSTTRLSVHSGGTVQVQNHLTSRNGIVQVQQVTSETVYSGSPSSVDLITGSTFTPKTSAPRFLIMIFCPVNTSDDSDAGNGNTNFYNYGRLEYRKSGGGWIECNNQGSTSHQGGYAAHIELSPNRTGNNTTDYWSGNRYRTESKTATILVTNVGDCGSNGTVQFKLRCYSYSGNFIQIGQPHGMGSDVNYGVQPWGFTVFELAPDSNSYTAY